MSFEPPDRLPGGEPKLDGEPRAGASAVKRFGATFAAIAGALPLVLASWAYELGMLSFGQYGGWRTWGFFGVLAAGLAAVALVLAGLAKLLGLDRASPSFFQWLRAVFCLTAAVNLAAVGTAIFHTRYDPWTIYVLTLLPVLAAVIAYWRHSEAERVMIARALYRLGLAAMVLPLLATPGVLAAFSEYQARRALSTHLSDGMRALPDAPKRIILITFDSLRYRSTSFANRERPLTPGLRALGAEGTWYANCHSAGNRTLLSVPAILTGVRANAFYDAVDNRGGYLSEGLLTGLSGLLASAGYRSYYSTMFISPLHVGLGSEFVKGGVINPIFKPMHFTNKRFLPMHLVTEWAAAGLQGLRAAPEAPVHPVLATRATFDRALRLLRSESERAFIWVHVGAPHSPYYDVPPSDLGGELHPERYTAVTDTEVLTADGPTLARYERVYESYARFADAEFARFVAGMKAAGIWDDSLVVVTADHGEGFSATSRQHGNELLVEDVTHVPLVIRVPGQRGDQRDDRQAAHVDIVPTVLAKVYGRSPAGLTGSDLFGANAAAERVTYTWSSFYHRTELGKSVRGSFAAYQGRTKLVTRRHSGEALYDLAADPLEQHDLSRIRPKTLEAMKEQARREFR
jgi:arylsulfatase A-like enzyme